MRTSPDDDLGTRLVGIEEGIEQWLDDVRPDAVAVERVFSQHNVRTVMGTAQAAGIAVLCAARRGLPVALHTPSEVKAAITGSGTADKKQIGAMVTRLLRLTEMPKPADAADALALAICHIWRGGNQQRLAQAVARAQSQRRTPHPSIPPQPRRTTSPQPPQPRTTPTSPPGAPTSANSPATPSGTPTVAANPPATGTGMPTAQTSSPATPTGTPASSTAAPTEAPRAVGARSRTSRGTAEPQVPGQALGSPSGQLSGPDAGQGSGAEAGSGAGSGVGSGAGAAGRTTGKGVGL
ncbi:crossover junction endodeoxyribonuclease RuvC [Nonomuraea endophytica]|uniref:Crossover junction endodeoxyribonuclease RuvC n=1 Tax=Nonomuraea endophytica TaxID=714136 RepID=A0A7W8A2T2_9ACTN|nr:crossover junction endodeoxyribonuclease RuvC [Nonomuraea endophytica]